MLAELKRAVEASTPAPGAPPPSASTAVKPISAGREKGRSQIDSEGGRPVKSNPEISVGPRPALQKSPSSQSWKLIAGGLALAAAATVGVSFALMNKASNAPEREPSAAATERFVKEVAPVQAPKPTRSTPLRRRAVVGGRLHPDPAGRGGHAGALGSDQAGRDANCTGPTLPRFDRFGASGSGAEDGGSRATGQAGHWDNCDSARPRLDRFSASASVAQDGSAAAGGPATAGKAGRRDSGDSAGRRFDRFRRIPLRRRRRRPRLPPRQRPSRTRGQSRRRRRSASRPISASSSGAEAERNVGSVHLERILQSHRRRSSIQGRNRPRKRHCESLAGARKPRTNRLVRRSVARSSRRTRKKRRNRPSPRQPPAVRLQSRQLRRRRSRSGSPMA